jgi:hypothetical protein
MALWRRMNISLDKYIRARRAGYKVRRAPGPHAGAIYHPDNDDDDADYVPEVGSYPTVIFFAVQLNHYLHNSFPMMFSSCSSEVTIGFIPTRRTQRGGARRRPAVPRAPRPPPRRRGAGPSRRSTAQGSEDRGAQQQQNTQEQEAQS